MPDKFFASAKSRKRKRPESRPNARTKVPKKPRIDEDLSEQSDEWGGIDEIDLRPEEPDPGASGDEEEDETPAEKRLRLAQLYLDSVKDSLGACCRWFDIISTPPNTPLQQMENLTLLRSIKS